MNSRSNLTFVIQISSVIISQLHNLEIYMVELIFITENLVFATVLLYMLNFQIVWLPDTRWDNLKMGEDNVTKSFFSNNRGD